MKLKMIEAYADQVSNQFHQGMVDRMLTGVIRYGKVEERYPDKVNAIEHLEKRLKKYKETGNTEFLMDVANFAMIEFMRPKHPDAHFTPEDRKDDGVMRSYRREGD